MGGSSLGPGSREKKEAAKDKGNEIEGASTGRVVAQLSVSDELNLEIRVIDVGFRRRRGLLKHCVDEERRA